MTADIATMRDVLLPGLLAVRYTLSCHQWTGVFGQFETTMAAPHIWVPKLSIPQALAIGAAAAIIKNPEVTRRFWSGWLS